MAFRTISILIVVATIISCASSLPPAEPSKNMMEQANQVILTIDQDPERVFHDLRTYLLDKGFSIQRAKMSTLSLQTGYREYGATVFGVLGGYSMRVFASVKDSTVTFSGQLDTGTKVENNGGKASPVKDGWNQMVEMSKDFPHKNIYYSRN